MLSLFDNGASAPCPSPFNLAAHVLGRAKALPDKVALSVVQPGNAENWRYDELETAVRGTATGLLKSGLKPGDILLMRLGNTVDFPVAYLGAIAAGIVPVPTSSQLTETEVAAMVQALDPAAILVGAGVPCPPTDCPVYDTATMAGWRNLPPADYAMGDPDRLAYIIYTSGTSGRPRAVGHAHRAIWARQMMMRGWYGLSDSDRLLHAGAFNWTYTLGTGLMDPWTMGATALIPAAGVDHASIAPLLHDHKVSIFAAAPGVYRNILKHPTGSLPYLRHGLAAGEKLSLTLRYAWENATGTQIFEAFGMSECSTFLSASPEFPADEGALGRPQPGRRVAILGLDGPVPRGEPGTIAIHRDDPGLMLGYVGAPEETAAKFQGDWFITGDQGVMLPSDQITYLGRDDDMMNAGGYRVSPIEVEAALLTHPDITEVGVTEVEVKADVGLIAAFYTGPAPIPDNVLTAWAADRLARYKQPRMFVHLDTLPRNPNGKLLRRALRPLLPN
ncbi:class I adenylate-forming enzyme family protein [Puniceibacterium sp. IMCC21224]|uniref:class I adenylate-forming enzyme family protein n=1 Tax=Puniceibacterium sp. IMCC21224 TaxID=1618204 RepID=UPI00064DB5E0|nr:class I adenylate-forming enzyme family protein [Puniceibacterium sp. IMCC21224]KMK67145.1 acyl-CoA synthetase (AMP-forming)/AMP-acid ligase II [Puniceibacterium sp. IMCC21224]